MNFIKAWLGIAVTSTAILPISTVVLKKEEEPHIEVTQFQFVNMSESVSSLSATTVGTVFKI